MFAESDYDNIIGMVLYPLCFAQQKMYGYKYSEKGDI